MRKNKKKKREKDRDTHLLQEEDSGVRGAVGECQCPHQRQHQWSVDMQRAWGEGFQFAVEFDF